MTFVNSEHSYDVMQICLNGHIANDSFNSKPERNKSFCSECGEKTITKCSECGNQIQGAKLTRPTYPVKVAPNNCQSCGIKFPWINKRKEIQKADDKQKSFEILERLFSKFHTLAKQLRQRHNNRPTLDITNEYDVQDFLHVLLKIYFQDIRPEEYTPSFAGKSDRMDFLLVDESVAIETKMTRDSLTTTQLSDDLLRDIATYKEHSNCSSLAIFIYDPSERINNPSGVIKGLEKQSIEDFEVRVFINSR